MGVASNGTEVQRQDGGGLTKGEHHGEEKIQRQFYVDLHFRILHNAKREDDPQPRS